MATLSEVTQFLFDVASNDQLVNTIAFTQSDQIDKNKENLYPLFNIDIIETLFISGISNTRFRVTIVTDRDIKPRLHNDKVFNSNLIDNLNECHSIAGRFIQIVKLPNEGNITVEDITTITMLKGAYNNELDGVQFDMLLWHDISKSTANPPGPNDC